MRRLWVALSAVLLYLCPGTLTHGLVPAPESVRVQCGDQRPVVSWDYSPQQPTSFTVSLLGSGENYSVQTAGHELDLSDSVWSSADKIFGYLYVSVTANQGPNQSKPVLSPSFSYKRYKTVDVSCNLMFPPVNLIAEGETATLSFENPLNFYQELKNIKESADFFYSVFPKNQGTVPCGQSDLCKLSVALPKDAEPCVNVTGVINLGKEQILVQHDGPVCATAPSDRVWVVAILSVFLFVCVILLLTFAVCKTRAWVFPKIPPPQTLASFPLSLEFSKPQSETVYCPVQIIGTRPETIEDPESPSPEAREVQDEDQVPILPPDLDDYRCTSVESTNTETVSLRSSCSEVEVSNYERRTQLIDIDLSGDVVTGYTS